ncbi:NADP-dependent isocitrate dehydrogenase [Candidatus Synchoanobacter obligatus]|uniref:Isocitrate dehydrogenase [NADP] n=1 Tax=Candidatus Synchoanobacter obligatus TaxID=2919597 RepID=A0ABT1L691_9GAMM|nr:NADP-dependent isocitrate dehydrogenase [Candidatus Synchoanobacter obligatus]
MVDSVEKGQQIQWTDSISVPDFPIIPYIEGDGIGSDITPAMLKVVNHAVSKAYGDKRAIEWKEIFAGQKAFDLTGEWLPQDTIDAIEKYHVAIKGPLTTPVGGGIRSLNVALRQKLGLFICQRPVQYFEGVPSPMMHPEKVDITVFRENSEDIYIGIEFKAGDTETKRLLETLKNQYAVDNIARPENTGVGVKLISEHASKRLVRQALQYAISQEKEHVALVHKGNIMKYTEGAFCHWGYDVAVEEFAAKKVEWGYEIENPNNGQKILVTDVIADACFQQVLLKPENFDVIATMNLNGDYLSDALAAQIGGIGIAPGANLSDRDALFEATHGTAPLYAGKNLANPSSLILSAEMMLRHMGWSEAADKLIQGMRLSLKAKEVTQDFARHMEGVEGLSTSDFAQAICRHMR